MSRNDDSVYSLLVRVTALAQRAATDLLFEVGVTPLEQWLLEEIPPAGDASASEIAAALEVPTSTVTRALRRLEAQGWVTLHYGYRTDTRVLCARITSYGEMIRRVATGFETDIDRHALEDITQPRFAALISGLLHAERALRRTPLPGD